jgi:hypothetical protein
MCRQMMTVVLWAVLGTLANWLLIFVAALTPAVLIFGEHQNGGWFLWLPFFIRLMFRLLGVGLGLLGMVSGLIGGFLCIARQRFVTAASPCIGVVVGSIIVILKILDPPSMVPFDAADAAQTIEYIDALLALQPPSMVAAIAGGALGVLYAAWTWKPTAPPSPPARIHGEPCGNNESPLVNPPAPNPDAPSEST